MLDQSAQTTVQLVILLGEKIFDKIVKNRCYKVNLIGDYKSQVIIIIIYS